MSFPSNPDRPSPGRQDSARCSSQELQKEIPHGGDGPRSNAKWIVRLIVLRCFQLLHATCAVALLMLVVRPIHRHYSIASFGYWLIAMAVATSMFAVIETICALGWARRAGGMLHFGTIAELPRDVLSPGTTIRASATNTVVAVLSIPLATAVASGLAGTELSNNDLVVVAAAVVAQVACGLLASVREVYISGSAVRIKTCLGLAVEIPVHQTSDVSVSTPKAKPYVSVLEIRAWRCWICFLVTNPLTMIDREGNRRREIHFS